MMQVRSVPLASLKEYENNAKVHDEANIDAIKASIERFGNCDPIGVWTNAQGELVIVEGHGRKMALEALGYDTAEVIMLDHLTDEERRAYTLAHNQTTLMTDFDLDALEIELEALSDFGMEDFGFDDVDMGDMEYEDVEEVEPDFDAPTRCKEGDLWLLGDHRLLCGDSTKAENVERLMDGKLADLLCEDPPYNVAYEGKTDDALKIENDSFDNDGDFVEFLVRSFTAALSNLKPGGSFYIWHAHTESHNVISACKQSGMKVRQMLVWAKSTFALSRQDYQWRHEACAYGWKDGAPHFWNSDRKQTTVLEFDKPSRNAEHPTMKPVDLMAYQVQNSTKKGQIVLDCFGGSGSTLIACEQTDRACYMMELDPRYCDVIIERWEQLTERKAVKVA